MGRSLRRLTLEADPKRLPEARGSGAARALTSPALLSRGERREKNTNPRHHPLHPLPLHADEKAEPKGNGELEEGVGDHRPILSTARSTATGPGRDVPARSQNTLTSREGGTSLQPAHIPSKRHRTAGRLRRRRAGAVRDDVPGADSPGSAGILAGPNPKKIRSRQGCRRSQDR